MRRPLTAAALLPAALLLAACSEDAPAPSAAEPPPAITLPADMPPLKCADFEPPPVPKPTEKFTARRCTNPDGAVRWIVAFYPCTDGRIWPILMPEMPAGPAPEPVGPEFDKCSGR